MRIYSAHRETIMHMKKIKIKQLDNKKKDFVVATHKIEISLNYMIRLSSIANRLVWVPKICMPDLEHGHGSPLEKTFYLSSSTHYKKMGLSVVLSPKKR